MYKDEYGKSVYSSGDGVNVYCNKEKDTITVNRSEMGIAESYFTYFLKEKNGAWFFCEREHTNTAFGEKNKISDFEVIESFDIDKEETRVWLIKKIVEKWKKKGEFSFNVDGNELLIRLQKEFL